MEKFKCKNCGASDFVKKDDKYVCQYCGTEYPISEVEQKQANTEKNTADPSSSPQSPFDSHDTEKTGYVDAFTKKPKKKRGTGTTIFIIVIILVVIIVVFSTMTDNDSDSDASVSSDTITTAEDRKAGTSSDSNKASQQTAEVKNATANKESGSANPVDDFSYTISGSEIVLDRYEGKDSILEIYPSYTIDGETYTTDLSDFQVWEDSVKTLILDDGITEVNKSIFNSSEVEKIFFPKSMTYVYDYTLAYLHPDDNEPIQIYYAGTQEEWDEIFTVYTNIGDTDDSMGELVGEAAADFLNGLFGMEYDSSEFEYFFNATPQDMK